MINYQYIHTTQFESRMSIPFNEENPAFRLFNTIRETWFRGDGTRSFLYALTPKGEGVFVQGYEGSNVYLQGSLITAEDLPSIPTSYISKLVQLDSDDEGVLEERPLPPVLSDRPEDYGELITADLLPDLIEALIYEKKPILVLVNKYEDAVNYLKILGHILPPEIMYGQNFFIGTDLPEKPGCKVFGRTSSYEIGIRLNFVYNPYFDENAKYFVFNTITGKSTYRNSAHHSIHRLLTLFKEDLFTTRGINFIKNIDHGLNKEKTAFDEQRLEIISNQLLFNSGKLEREDKMKVAYSLLNSDAKLQEESINTLADYLFKNDSNMSDENFALLVSKFTKLPDGIINFLLGRMQNDSLSELQKGILVDRIAEDDSVGMYKKYLEALKQSPSFVTDNFALTKRILEKRLERDKVNHITHSISTNDFLRETVDYYDVRTWHGEQNNLFLSFPPVTPDDVKRGLEITYKILSVLLVSAFVTTNPTERTERLSAFVSYLHDLPLYKSSDHCAFLLFVIRVQRNIGDIGKAIYTDCILNRLDSFLFDFLEMKNAIESQLQGEILSIDQKTALYNEANPKESNGYGYNAMCSLIVSSIFEERIIEKSMLTLAEFDKIKNFYAGIPDQLRINISDGAKRALKEMDRVQAQMNIDRGIITFRRKIYQDYYNTLPDNEQKRIENKVVEKYFAENRIKKENATAEDYNNAKVGESNNTLYSSPKFERYIKFIIDDSIAYAPVTAKTGKAFSPKVFLISTLLALFSFLLLLIPPTVFTFATGNITLLFFMAKGSRFVNYYTAWIVPLTFLCNTIVYAITRRGKRLNRAAQSTLLICILPEFVYVATCIIIYFV